MTSEWQGRRRAAVLGSPIAHSLSPVLHTAAYAALDLDWAYTAHEVDEAALPGWLGRLDGSWGGLSLTMPLKQAVIACADEVSPLVAEVGVANTLVPAGGSWRADNTDISGLAAALRAAAVNAPRHPLVLGAGATGCSAIVALAQLGATEVAVAVRNPERAAMARAVGQARGLRVQVVGWQVPAGHDLVIATTPKGTTDALVVPDSPAVLFDVIYDPWPTALATAWGAAGGRVIGGFELLLHQAVLQVELMTGLPGPVEAMRAAGERALRH